MSLHRKLNVKMFLMFIAAENTGSVNIPGQLALDSSRRWFSLLSPSQTNKGARHVVQKLSVWYLGRTMMHYLGVIAAVPRCCFNEKRFSAPDTCPTGLFHRNNICVKWHMVYSYVHAVLLKHLSGVTSWFFITYIISLHCFDKSHKNRPELSEHDKASRVATITK